MARCMVALYVRGSYTSPKAESGTVRFNPSTPAGYACDSGDTRPRQRHMQGMNAPEGVEWKVAEVQTASRPRQRTHERKRNRAKCSRRHNGVRRSQQAETQSKLVCHGMLHVQAWYGEGECKKKRQCYVCGAVESVCRWHKEG